MGGKKRRRKKSKRQDRSAGDAAGQMTDELREQIAAWSREAAEAHGLGLFEFEPAVRGRWIIRVYVERLGDREPGEGVAVDQCAEVSRYLEAYLDADDRVPENYVLEVSSPGLERPLKRPEHVERAVGERVQLVTREQVDGRNKFVATLTGFDEGVLELELEPEDDEDEAVTASIHWDDVARARLKHDF